MNRHVNYLISGVARRYRLVWLAWFLSAAWVLWALAAIVVASTGTLPKLDGFKAAYLAMSAIAGTLLLGWSASRLTYRNPRWLATQIERHLPSLKERLITAVQVQETKGFFEKSLIDETIHHARSNDWSRTVSDGRVLMAWISQFMLLACAAWTILQCLGTENNLGNSSIVSLLNPASQALIVEPGDVEIERGKDVVVTVRFPIEAPAEVWLASTSEQNEPSRQTMVRSLKDPLFGGYVRNVQTDQEYRIEYGANSTKRYKIKTFEYPALVRSDAIIVSPLYANNATRTIENTRRVTVADGAELTWACFVNKPLLTAELVDESGVSTPMSASADEPLLYQAKFVMSESKRWSVRLVDKDRRAAKFEDDLSAKVIPNLPPEMKLAHASDLRVSPLQEVQIQATAKDDFGIQRSGLTLVMGDSEPQEVSLASMPAKSGKVELKHMVDLESLQAQPDQLLSYFFWAEDLDRDGNPRRVDGEMFFAEVRPFEEIFRQGESMSPEQQKQQQQQQQQPQSEGGKQAEELAEMQKQIVTATWNVLRREKPASLSKSFLEDAKTLLESQQSALEMTSEIEEKLKDEKSMEYLEDVRDAMTSAIQSLQGSVDASDLKTLRDALQSERKAYEGLLRLRAREHNVVKSQQPQSKSASKSSSQKNRQEQLEQLKLQDEEDKYESEKQADAPEPTAQREARQVMNRLEELARRQKDINEQLKNLETALREAKTEEKKQELEEQLKRLRDNQEDLLRDSDELLERMNQPENRQAMEQAREQTEQARSDLQQSAQSLSKGETSQALSSGTRAERQLDETREQMRKESSNQFEQTMRDLMHDASKLDQQQQKLAERIPSAKDSKSASERDKRAEESQSARSSAAETQNSRDGNLPDESATLLRPEGDEKAIKSLQQAIQQQKKDLNELLEKMRETVSEAESSEPLLAEQIYDSFREAKQQGLEQRLDQIPSFVDRGLEEPAMRATNEVSKGIRNLKENIEQASESVIGSEQESLRRALSELKRAQRQLDEEIARKDLSGGKSSQSADGERKDGEPGDPKSEGPQDKAGTGEQQPQGGQPQGGQPQGGQPQGGQPQGGQPQGGQPQNGQPQNGQPSGERQPNNQPANNSGRGRLGQLAEQSARQASESAPLTGENFTEWLDSLRDAEELVRAPELRAEAGRIREAARSMRIDYKRHAKEPEWPLVRRLIAEPLNQLREKVQEELLRQSAERNALIPIDRDPVPSVYQQQLDRYYENIGSGKSR